MKQKLTKEIKLKVKNLIKLTDKLVDIKSDIFEYRKYYIDLVIQKSITEKEFYILSSFLTPQARSPLWEKYFILKHKAKRIKPTLNNGDFLLNNNHYEFKISGFNQDKALHLVQIRLWQKCDYIFQYISKEINPPITFCLTHEQLKKETIILKASSAHGTKTANIKNVNKELRISIFINDNNWNRWIKLYKTNKFN